MNRLYGDELLGEAFPTLFSIADFKDVWLVEMWEQIGKDNHRFTRQIHDWELEKVKAFFRKLLAQSIRSGMEDKMVWQIE